MFLRQARTAFSYPQRKSRWANAEKFSLPFYIRDNRFPNPGDELWGWFAENYPESQIPELKTGRVVHSLPVRDPRLHDAIRWTGQGSQHPRRSQETLSEISPTMSIATFFRNAWRHDRPSGGEEGAGSVEGKTRPILWGRESSVSYLSPILPIFRPIGLLFSNKVLQYLAFFLGFMAMLWGGYVAHQTHGLLPVGVHGFWGKLLAIWFFANLSALVRASVTELGLGVEKPRIFLRIYLFLPFLKIHNPPFGDAGLRKTLRERLSGTAFLWTLGLMMVLYLQFSEPPWSSEPIFIIAAACFFTGLLQLSPWWSSPASDTLARSEWGRGFPWPSWHHIWGGLWTDLFGSAPKTDEEKFLTKTSLYLILWTLMGLRATTYIVRSLATMLHIHSHHADSSHHGWALTIAAAVVALFGLIAVLSVVLLIILRGTRFVVDLFK